MSIDNRIIDVMLEANDCLKQMIGDVHNSEQFNIAAYIEDINALTTEKQTTASPQKETDTEISAPGETAPGADNQEQLFLSAAQRGLKVYTICIPVEQEMAAPTFDPPAEIVENVNSIGNILQIYRPGEWTRQGAPTAWHFLLTSVPEKACSP